MDFREFLDVLEDRGNLIRISREVDKEYEIAAVMRALEGKPVLFERVKGHSIPVVGNVCCDKEAACLALGITRENLLSYVAKAIETPAEPKTLWSSEYEAWDPDLSALPILTYYPFDGGPYIASGVVAVGDRDLDINLSYHRIMVLGKDRIVMRVLPRHFHAFLEKGVRHFAVCIGTPVSVMLAASVSLPLGKSELAVANALSETPVIHIDGHTVPRAEIILLAEMTGEEADEGPFLDLTGTLDIVRKQPVARIIKIYVRPNPCFHALLPGGREHRFLMGMPKEPVIFREVSKVCECLDVWLSSGGCSWLHGSIRIRKRSAGEGKQAIEAAFRAHPSIKHVFVVDEDIDIYNPQEMEWAMATRFQGDRDLVVKEKELGSSLDPSSDLMTRRTTKIGFDLTMPEGRRPEEFRRPGPSCDVHLEDYLAAHETDG